MTYFFHSKQFHLTWKFDSWNFLIRTFLYGDVGKLVLPSDVDANGDVRSFISLFVINNDEKLFADEYFLFDCLFLANKNRNEDLFNIFSWCKKKLTLELT